MKNKLNRFRNKGLWLSILALAPMIAQGFGLHFIPANYSDMVNSVLSILVVAGVLNNPVSGNWYLDKNDKVVEGNQTPEAK